MAEELEWKTRRDRINTKLKALTPAWSIVSSIAMIWMLLNCYATRLKNFRLPTVLLIMLSLCGQARRHY